MINTVHIKEQLPVFQVGSGPTNILIVGSCRAVAYLNYLHRYNETNGNPFSIYFIEPHNFHWRVFPGGEELVDLQAALTICETDPRILDVVSNAHIYIHEHYASFGMFNSAISSEKNLWQFGLKPSIEIKLPNFHDHFILAQEQVDFNADGITDRIKADGRIITDATRDLMFKHGMTSLDRFYDVCHKSSFPEFAGWFQRTWVNTRYFWTGNHVSKHFTLYLFERMCKMLGIHPGSQFWIDAGTEDMFREPHTRITEHDLMCYGLRWDEPVEKLKLP